MHKLLLCALLCAASSSYAQKKETFKFEKITPAHLQTKVYAIDSNAHAIVLGDVGSIEIEGNTKGWFSFIYKHRKRVHILNKAAYDAAKFSIPLYASDGYEEKIESIRAVTYNLENGAVVETKFDRDNIFSEKVSRERSLKKLTLPAVKEGSIIDIEYRIHSDYLNSLEPWNFQGEYPVLWSEFTLALPSFLEYAFIGQGYVPFYIYDKSDRVKHFDIADANTAGATERFTLKANVTDHRWVTRNVPAFHNESFTTSVRNHITHIEFQLAAFKDPLVYKSMIGSWREKTKELLEHEDFGKKLDNSNAWLTEVMKPIMEASSQEEKAKRIYAYVRDNIRCTNHNSIYLTQPLRQVLRTRAGSVSDVNLLLVSMLKYAEIQAEPVMLSTRGNGLIYTNFPMLTRFNYVIAAARVNEKEVFLDASQPQLGYGRLIPDCYNGQARVINYDASIKVFSADSLKERKIVSVIFANDAKGWIGTKQTVPGYYESHQLRSFLKTTGQEAYLKKLQESHGDEAIVTGLTVDSIHQYDEPVKVSYDMQFRFGKEDVLYINPLFGEGQNENPFKSAERAYPVEMPYSSEELINVTMDVPTGYVVDEIPKQVRVKFNEQGDGYFEYLVSVSNDVISLRSHIKFNKATFMPDEYETLRAFYDMVVSKQKEQIVFKKKK